MTRHLPARIAVLATLVLVVLALLTHVQAQKPASQAELLLGKALNLEDVAGNLKDAIATYEQVLKAPDATRAQKARAQFRIGACYERLGVDGARKAYEAVVANYGDMTDFASQAKSRLAAMGQGAAAVVPTVGGGPNLRMLWRKQNWLAAKISPDGKQVAFIDSATANLWVRDVATGTDRNLTNTPKEKAWIDFTSDLSWSHDGTRLAYDWFAGPTSEIRIVDVRTGAIAMFQTTRSDSPVLPNPSAFSRPADWSPDDSRVLVSIGFSTDQGRLAWLSVKDGTVTELKATRGEYRYRATVSPDGTLIAYAARRAGMGSDWDVYIARSDGSSTRVLIGGPTSDAPVAWTPDGTGLIYQGNRSSSDWLWVVRVSGGQAVGEPVAVPGVGRIEAYGLTRSGAMLYATGGRNTDLWLATVDLAAGKTLDRQTLAVPGGSRASAMGSYSPDGSLMTYDVGVGKRTGMVFARADGGQPRLFTPSFQPVQPTPPMWSADSRSVYRYGAPEPTTSTIFRVDVQTGASEPVFPAVKIDYRAPGDQPSYQIGVSSDGRTAYYQKINREPSTASLWSRDVGTGQEKELFRTEKGDRAMPGGVSPDGKRLILALWLLSDGGRRELRTLSLENGAMTTICKLGGSMFDAPATWSPDARHVVYGLTTGDAAGNPSTELWVVDDGGGQPRSLGITHPSIRGVAVHPDGKHIAYVTSTLADQEAWLLENFLPPAKTGAARK